MLPPVRHAGLDPASSHYNMSLEATLCSLDSGIRRNDEQGAG